MAQTSKQPLGELYQPLSPEHLADPYPFYELARRQEPIFFSPMMNAYVVTRLKDVRVILEDSRTFSSVNVFRPVYPFHSQTLNELSKGYPRKPLTIESDGDKHRRERAALNKLLSPAQVKLMEPTIQGLADRLVETFINDGHADLISQYTKRLPLEVICGLLGVEPSDVDKIDTASDAFLEILVAADEQIQVEAAQKMVSLHKLLARYVLQRRGEPRDDFTSKMMAVLAPGDGPLTREQEGEVAQTLGALVSAAHETVSISLSEGVKQLLSDPEQWRLLCLQPDLLPTIVEEIVRFSSPGQAFFRVATRDVVVGDEQDALQLPAGTQFLLLYGSANHDEAVCPHAGQFDIHRSLKSHQHVGFGHGMHFCVGAHLARQETIIGLRTLMQRIPHLRLRPNQTFEYRQLLVTRGLGRLEVEW